MWGVTTGAIVLPVQVATLPCQHGRHDRCAGQVELTRLWGRGRTVTAHCVCACHTDGLLQ